MRLFFTLFLALAVGHSFGQTRSLTFSGKVMDAVTGLPLPGASVYLADARIGAVADAEGRYQFRYVPTGHHLVEVTHTGYTAFVEHIDIARDIVKDFKLSSAVVENQGVTITGVAHATSIRNAPVPVTLVRRSDMLQTPSTTIMDVLAKQPGISQVSTGPAVSKPVIRGLGYNRVVVINDGMRQEGQQWGDEHGIEIDELSVTRAEILKGPGSIMYGSDALAGVVNFITNVPVTEGTVRGNVYTNYQTNNNLKSVHANLAGHRNGFNWNVYGSGKSAKDYRNKYDGRVLNSRFNERNFGGYAGINKQWGFSHLIVSSFNQNLGLVEGDRDDATGAFLLFTGTPEERIATQGDYKARGIFTPYQNVQHYKVISDNSFGWGRNRIRLNAGFQNNLRREFGEADDPFTPSLFFDLKTINYNLQWALPENNEWQVTFGTTGMKQSNRNRAEEVIIPEYGLFDIGGFVFSQKFFPGLTLSGGLRYDHRTINSDELMEGSEEKFRALKRSFANVSGTAGVSYTPSTIVTLKGNIARGFRAPTLSELASNGAHEGTNRYEYGSPDLTSERSLQVDGGLDLDYEHFTFSMALFHNSISDFIFYSRLENVAGGDSMVTVDGEELEAFRYNQNNARLSGFELSVDLHPHPLDWLHFENNFSFIRGRFDQAIDGSSNLPLIPAPRWNSELRANFSQVGKGLQNLYARFETEYTFAQNRPFLGYGTETATPGYTLLNLGAGTDILKKGKTIFSLHLAATNLTDKAYQSHLSRLKYAAENMATGRQGVFNMGRNFSVKLNVPLQWNVQRN